MAGGEGPGGTGVPALDAPVRHREPVALHPLVTRVTAANPSVFTGPGTNTYLLGSGGLVVVDPGPEDAAHTDAILAAAGGRPVTRILVTHHHPDHAPGARLLAERTGAPVAGFDPGRLGPVAAEAIGEGWSTELDGLRITAVHTPGHASDHLCFSLDLPAPGPADPPARVLLTGDHVMEGSTVVIHPPDGDMAVYVANLARVRDAEPPYDALAPGHGKVIPEVRRTIDALLAHRHGRGQRVLDALAAVPSGATLDELVTVVYSDVEHARHPIARWSLWAHLRELHASGLAACDDPDAEEAAWRPVTPG